MTITPTMVRRGRIVPAALALALTVSALLPTSVAAASPTLKIDVAANRHVISPDIYGMNFADPALAAELHLTVDRGGGNTTSRYNWQNNTYNTGNDYFFENIPPLYGGSGAAGLIDKD